MVKVIKAGTAILFGLGVLVFFWFYTSSREEQESPPNSGDEPIYILEGDNIVEILQPTGTQITKAPNTGQLIQAPAKNKEERIKRGKEVYHKICIACHQPNGQGVPSVFPPLAKSDFLNSDKERAIGIVTNGLAGEIVVNGTKFHNLMPNPGLNDDEISNVLTYVYSQWGNSGMDVTLEEVNAVRKLKKKKRN